MIKKYRGLKLLFFLFILIGSIQMPIDACNYKTPTTFCSQDSIGQTFQKDKTGIAEEIQQLNISLQSNLTNGYLGRCQVVVDSIIQKIDIVKKTDNRTIADSYYLIGVYHLLKKNIFESIKFLQLVVDFKERNNEYDERYAKALYNLGVANSNLGDFNKLENYSLKSLEILKKIYGESSPNLMNTYSSVIIACIELQEYEKAIYYSNIELSIVNSNQKQVSPAIQANLYNNLGVCFNRLADFSKAKIYLEKSKSIYEKYNLTLDDNFITLLNSTAIAYGALGLSEKSEEYYERGIALALSNNSSLAYNFINSYAIILGNAGKKLKGQSLLKNALNRVKTKYGENSRSYFEVLNNYADYLREYKIDNTESLDCYSRCVEYLEKNDSDQFLKTRVNIGYSLSLTEAGEPWKALEIIQSLLFPRDKQTTTYGSFENPGMEKLKTDKKSLTLLRVKYKILWDIYKRSSDQKTLEAASNTAELIVLLLEKIRIRISEEESRLILGDKYRDSYLNALRDFNLLYKKTDDSKYLEKAFEYLEKSKVAALLTSTRELKATQLHIPSEIADFESKLQKEISLYNARIAEEAGKEEPDTILVKKWNENLLGTTRILDALTLVFEKQYPDYYAFKYNTHVLGLSDVPKIVGRNGNYINYIASDTILYIFVANRKHQQFLALPIDSTFFSNIRQFRSLLLMPSPSENARIPFEHYLSTGHELYKTLVDPVRPYLISNQLLISPDNILSYIPFEALPVEDLPASSDAAERILYNKIAYMMRDFNISYTYSATFMAESKKGSCSYSNSLIAFALDYSEPLYNLSVPETRNGELDVLTKLPYARKEAEYVSKITGGKLFLNSEARESVYKAESGKFDILHLAMHTLINDKDPLYSTLIFKNENDTIEDGYLKTYEVYEIPLNAKMVVLSSCNTGTGLLYSGEGILSLARGFTYAGSESVVMSMWEIEDRSGTDIIEMFYKNLKRGYSKSDALKKARIDFLKNADQQRSHPYFWSTLVIYGENTPLYYSKRMIFAVVLIVFFILAAALTLYFRKRKYS